MAKANVKPHADMMEMAKLRHAFDRLQRRIDGLQASKGVILPIEEPIERHVNRHWQFALRSRTKPTIILSEGIDGLADQN